MKNVFRFLTALIALGMASPAIAAEPEEPDRYVDEFEIDAEEDDGFGEGQTSAATAAALAKLKERDAELQKAIDDAELTSQTLEAERAAERDAEDERLRIYGFMDAGLSKISLSSDTTPLTIFINDANSFVVGNVNLYFDARPVKQWRSLFETRFTLYPTGTETSELVEGRPTLVQNDTRVFDTANSSGRNEVVRGSVVLERAWVEYQHRDWLTLRAGYFLTPFGIWNVDHGLPTLITLLLPNFQIAEYMPNRLTGVLAYGTFDLLPYQLKYYAHVSNGRQIAPFRDDDDDKALGGRLELSRKSSVWQIVGGASAYGGDATSFQKQLRFEEGALDGFDRTYDYDYDEVAAAVDFSLDVGELRLRSEYLVRRVLYNEGRHEESLGEPGLVKPNRIEHSIYGLSAYRFTEWFEPYAYYEYSFSPDSGQTADSFRLYSGGINLHFNARVSLKTQYAYVQFLEEFEGKYDTAPSDSNLHSMNARLILSF